MISAQAGLEADSLTFSEADHFGYGLSNSLVPPFPVCQSPLNHSPSIQPFKKKKNQRGLCGGKG